jgi:hypothetical protein
MNPSRPHFTIRHLMIGVGGVALILALVHGARDGDPFASVVLILVVSTCPLWGTIGLAFLEPTVTRWVFLASCLVVFLACGYNFVIAARIGGSFGVEWLVLVLGVLWIIVPIGFGHLLSKDFHVWKAKERNKAVDPLYRSEFRPPSST